MWIRARFREVKKLPLLRVIGAVVNRLRVPEFPRSPDASGRFDRSSSRPRLRAVDNQHLQRTFRRFQLQSPLLTHRRKNRWADIIWRRRRIFSGRRLARARRGELKFEFHFVSTCQSGSVLHDAAQGLSLDRQYLRDCEHRHTLQNIPDGRKAAVQRGVLGSSSSGGVRPPQMPSQSSTFGPSLQSLRAGTML